VLTATGQPEVLMSATVAAEAAAAVACTEVEAVLFTAAAFTALVATTAAVVGVAMAAAQVKPEPPKLVVSPCESEERGGLAPSDLARPR